MPSPFPGVDPFLEASGLWEGFHERLIIHLSDLLSERVPRRYWVNIQERITSIGLPEGERHQFVADIGVSAINGHPTTGDRPTGSIATMEPVTRTMKYEEPARESYLEILRLPERQIVTVIEILSPSNKELPGRELYKKKRESLLNQFVHVVEIDFLIQGTRLPTNEPLPDADYFAFVARADQRPRCEVYPWLLPQLLPTIPIPLQDPDPDINLDLGALWNHAFTRGRYDEVLRYSAGPPAFVRPADRDWVSSIVAKCT